MSGTKKGDEHPPYKTMITQAILAEKSLKGISTYKCLRYICSNYKVKANAKIQVRLAIVRLMKSGYLVQTKGKGAAGSFKLSAASKEQEKKKMQQQKKKAKGAVTKAVAPKKPAQKAKKPIVTKAKKPAAKKVKATPKKNVKKTVKKPVKKTVKKTVVKQAKKPAKKQKTPKKKASPKKKAVRRSTKKAAKK